MTSGESHHRDAIIFAADLVSEDRVDAKLAPVSAGMSSGVILSRAA